MSSEQSLRLAFIDFLFKNGYPKDSLISESVTQLEGRRYIFDLIIADPSRNEQIAIVEFKELTDASIRTGCVQLKQYQRVMGDSTVFPFLVTPANANNTSHPFQIYTLNSDGEPEPLEPSLFPSFQALSAAKIAARKSELKQQQNKTIDSFRRVCWILAALLLVIVTADFILSRRGIILLTTQRLWLLGGIVALSILPDTQKLSWLNVLTFERRNNPMVNEKEG